MSCDCALRSFWDGPCPEHAAEYAITHNGPTKFGDFTAAANIEFNKLFDPLIEEAVRELGFNAGESNECRAYRGGSMEFEVTEVKLLRGKDAVSTIVEISSGCNGQLEYCDSLSLRLEAVPQPSVSFKWKNKFTIHAVVPWHIVGGKPPSIGDKFEFSQLTSTADPYTTKFCKDSACKHLSNTPHEFGKGCRLWKE